tara:strand:- start:24 stop:353 length:330 start_codon:yes stop_codon:yes gene_type:complete
MMGNKADFSFLVAFLPLSNTMHQDSKNAQRVGKGVLSFNAHKDKCQKSLMLVDVIEPLKPTKSGKGLADFAQNWKNFLTLRVLADFGFFNLWTSSAIIRSGSMARRRPA